MTVFDRKDFNPFRNNGLFLYPMKTFKTSGFLIFSGGIEIGQ